MMFELSSPAFTDGAVIPEKHTCDGADVSPALRWANPPKATRRFTLIVDDPHAPMGTWVHWVLYNLPADLRELPEAVPPDDSFPNGMHEGISDFKRIRYGGPCPPPGKPHRYFFTLYAVNAMLNLKPRAKGQVLEASQGHIQAETKLMGRYGR